MAKVREKRLTVNDFFSKAETAPLPDDFTGKNVIIFPMSFSPQYRTRKFLVYQGVGGFGCESGKMGRGVFGRCVGDGADERVDRGMVAALFIGDIEALKAE